VARTTKISIAIDKDDLRCAQKAARADGVSLSRYIARALSRELEERERIEAARELHRAWGPASVPTAKERDEFLTRMTRRRRGQAA
jgi:hypothetical protein